MEYARNAVRLAALMKTPNIFVYTRDSVAVGEDGPTHQPVEQISNLRSTLNLFTWRPCDTVESAVAWKHAIRASRAAPTALIFTRQKTQAQIRDAQTFNNIQRGGYTLIDCDNLKGHHCHRLRGRSCGGCGPAACCRRASGAGGINALRRALQRSRCRISTAGVTTAVRARVAVEAGHPDLWHKFVGLDGAVVGIDRYGLSAPGEQALEVCGITSAAVVAATKQVIDV